MHDLERIEEPIWGESKKELDFNSGPNARAVMVWRRGMEVPNPLWRQIAPDKYQRLLEIAKKKHILARELARNRFIPIVWVNSRGQWYVSWRIQGRGAKKIRVIRGVMEFDDGAALQLILTLARAGYLKRLQRCTCCRAWIYVKFKHQHFCSTKCQQRHYAKSKEWKEKRRLYMREYRGR
jgi:hypothetical protein